MVHGILASGQGGFGEGVDLPQTPARVEDEHHHDAGDEEQEGPVEEPLSKGEAADDAYKAQFSAFLNKLATLDADALIGLRAEALLPRLICVTDTPETLPFDQFGQGVAVKATRGSERNPPLRKGQPALILYKGVVFPTQLGGGRRPGFLKNVGGGREGDLSVSPKVCQTRISGRD